MLSQPGPSGSGGIGAIDDEAAGIAKVIGLHRSDLVPADDFEASRSNVRHEDLLDGP